MMRRHCDVCDMVLDRRGSQEGTTMVRSRDIAVKPDIERWAGDHWVPSVDYCRKCLGDFMFEYSQWLLRKL